ncbi:MAG: aromatic ring-hydroxylating dioxygenase subunit alpha [Dehalococcoidia bacterium]|nr:aromatic ring-hydroxylating dioxygenase subunit alpha [Dehalococcoidia bacterium]
MVTLTAHGLEQLNSMVSTNNRLMDPKNGYLDRSIFSDSDLYQQELEQVFGRCWLFIGHESQVAKPNDFVANYMGEDPILLTRDSKGKLHSFLNMCRHRGNRICRADAGNAPSFMCTYHGWTFATDGKLVGVPGYKEAYFEELDRSQWGLVEAAQISSYKGLVFATWDKQAPSLEDYLGDAAWYLDLVVDRREGGTELLDGVHKWVLAANWKFGADNFGGDDYHFPITHGSVLQVNPNVRFGRINADSNRVTVNSGNGHNILGRYIGNQPANQFFSAYANMAQYYQSTLPETEQRLGAIRARQGNLGIATIFPNFTWHIGPMVRIWQPRGAAKMEVWSYCIVDKKTPEDVRDSMRRNLIRSFGPGGATEHDDMNNWIQCTSTSLSSIERKTPMVITMGLGHETRSELIPGVISANVSETNQRAFYSRWLEMMNAPSWDQITVAPKTK